MIEIKNKNGEVIFTYNGDLLESADLRGANIREAKLSHADLTGANLRGAELSDADLEVADLSYADLRCANLRFADLSYANLRGADLSWANLRCANLRGADISKVDLYGADFTDSIIDETTKGLNYQCPKEGSFIGYKKCYVKRIECGRITSASYIVELEIPADARRSSSVGTKCRCDKAKVLSITNLDGTKTYLRVVHSLYDYDFIYELGEIVTEPNFNEKYWNECTKGIHFFMDRKNAVDY